MGRVFGLYVSSPRSLEGLGTFTGGQCCTPGVPSRGTSHSLCSPQKGCAAAREGCAEFTQERLTGQLSPVIYSSDILTCFLSSPLRRETTNNMWGEDWFESAHLKVWTRKSEDGCKLMFVGHMAAA